MCCEEERGIMNSLISTVLVVWVQKLTQTTMVVFDNWLVTKKLEYYIGVVYTSIYYHNYYSTFYWKWFVKKETRLATGVMSSQPFH